MARQVKPKSICPHCSKETEGAIRDKGLFFFIVCSECDTILGVLPKFYQKCSWKMPEKAPTEGPMITTPTGR
jgi:ssDNA-binding Zn-finger/Zn-ribbon topoisomerase 1